MSDCIVRMLSERAVATRHLRRNREQRGTSPGLWTVVSLNIPQLQQ